MRVSCVFDQAGAARPRTRPPIRAATDASGINAARMIE